MKEKMYLVTDIHFDITDGGNDEDEWTDEEYAYIFENDGWTCYEVNGGYNDVGISVNLKPIPDEYPVEA